MNKFYTILIFCTALVLCTIFYFAPKYEYKCIDNKVYARDVKETIWLLRGTECKDNN